ncbi:MAG: thioredoxin family protein [Phaeodactylibacter sp.]|nr:thioredoxin family protein [Phaeodactylibacter sp.]MCB9292123.1 thioredoxin family protein [Lewinellaceae bacterium]
MKKISTLLAFLLLAAFAIAQGKYTAENEGWLVDIDQAYALSQKTGKPIMANFTGSDWCGWCKRLTANVFSQPEFKKWADNNVILLELDFPRRKQIPDEIRQQNHSLQQAFQVRGYPTVWVFNLEKNKDGQYAIEALGQTGYTPTVQQFTSGVDQMLQRAAKGG